MLYEVGILHWPDDTPTSSSAREQGWSAVAGVQTLLQQIGRKNVGHAQLP